MTTGFRCFSRALLIGAALCLALSDPAAASSPLRILHLNDLHGWLLPRRAGDGGPAEGGVARMAALAGRLRNEATLLVAAGDLMQGTNVSNFFQGRPVIEALNLMGLDGSALGNHDFDYGLAVLGKRAAEADFPFLASNIDGAPPGVAVPGIVLDVGELRVGLFGLTTEETPITTHPKNVAALSFLPAVERAAREVKTLEAEGADLIVCLSHLGLPADAGLAAAVPGIDVIVGGHTHSRLKRPLLVGSTVVVQAGADGAFLGLLDLVVGDGRVLSYEGQLLPVDGRAGEDGRVAAVVEEAHRRVSARMDEVVGRAEVELEGRRQEVRRRETNLGSLVADVVRAAAAADVAIINGGSIRSSIPAGAVTLAHLYNALPFDNHVVSFVLTGGELREALEEGLSRLETGGGGFPQVAGLMYVFSPDKPAGSRLIEVRVGGRPLDQEGLYRVATNDFLAAGGDGYRVFSGKAPLLEDSGSLVRDLLAEHWRREGQVNRRLLGRAVEEVR